ncbi:cytochrome d ubiquinol oxidase, subunit II [Desulfurobacterium thermolithotrophum DSM 11699]|uniref:Cytochrome d ubiquinol oxidase, subunit II n=1 Tax=Desulfurobacterium thermolithotrophum (strain DSM 11699 / BSA) TaxID=868864 RepID=F0S227_DESTD|nr:cytochrome d ubiquinol oxidase subunit II [Desulfurobacterium thermolithotrophum]ADY72970.1 cytochrome d ubiquinol oxidase, subunit II [Desulfurobacterium thermolithotrophum DSM 11699]
MHFDLPTIWAFLVTVLIAGYILTDGFDLGVGILHGLIAKTDIEKRVMLNSIGPVWDGNEVWFITAGGAAFAAFPELYAALFSSLYIALFIVLLALIFRAVSFEFRSKEADPGWRKLWDQSIFWSSLIVALLIGVAIGNILAGIPIKNTAIEGEKLLGFIYTEKFPISFINLVNPFTFHGFYGLLVGIATVLFVILHGVSWLLWKTEGEIAERARNVALKLWLPFVIMYVVCTGLAYTISFKVSNLENIKYLGLPEDTLQSIASMIDSNGVLHHALFRYPAIELTLIVLAALSAVGYLMAVKNMNGARAFLFSSLTFVFAGFAVFFGAYPLAVPSSFGLEHSISIYNGASSTLTLTVMLVAALIFTPIVIAYQAWVYKMFLFKISTESIKREIEEAHG